MTKKKQSSGDKSPASKKSEKEIKEEITGIKQDPGIRNKQDRIQAEISGDIDNAISADEKKPNDSSRPSRKRRRA